MPYIARTHRFGLLTPSANTTQEVEFTEILPRTVSLHTARMSVRNIDRETMLRCVDELEAESQKLADADVGAIVFAATAPSLAKGKGYDLELVKRIEDASGKPATTSSTAYVGALNHLGVRRVAIAAPWSHAMNAPMVTFMEANGFEIVSCESLGFVQNVELGRADPETAYELGCRVDRPTADAVIMPGGNWLTMSVVERIEATIGKPVLTNNAASIWAGLTLMGRDDRIEGYGRLLRDHVGRGARELRAGAGAPRA